MFTNKINSMILEEFPKDFTEFEKFIPEDFLVKFAQLAERERVFTPLFTLWAFIRQVLSPLHTCQQAVYEVIKLRLVHNLPMCSSNTSAYCQARKKLKLDLLAGLGTCLGKQVEQKVPLWKGHKLKFIDGSLTHIDDTQENQRKYPQSRSQKEGLGFPTCRPLFVTEFFGGSVLNMVLGKFEGKGEGETNLLRRILNTFDVRDIVILDRYYDGFDLYKDMKNQGIEFIVRSKSQRALRLKKVKRLGKNDYICELTKGKNGPEKQLVRLVTGMIGREGFRDKEIFLLTSLLDEKKYSRKEMLELFKLRWNIELDFRNLKTTLKMEHIHVKTPEMFEKAMWVYVIAYNIVRMIMLKAGIYKGTHSRRISFKRTVQILNTFGILLTEKTYQLICFLVAQSKLPLREYRYEPRAIKKRNNKYGYLTIPRYAAKKQKWGYSRRRGKIHFGDAIA